MVENRFFAEQGSFGIDIATLQEKTRETQRKQNEKRNVIFTSVLYGGF